MLLFIEEVFYVIISKVFKIIVSTIKPLAFVILNIFCFCNILFAQIINPKLDSLWNKYNTSKHDTTRIKIYIELGDVYKSKNIDSALLYYQKALQLCENSLFAKSSKIDEKVKIFSLKASSTRYIGVVYASKGDNDKSLEFYLKSLNISEQIITLNPIEGKKNMAASYNNIGLVHQNKSDYSQALEFYFKAIKLREEINDKEGLASSYNNMGNIHSQKGDYDNALEYYFKSLKIAEEINNNNGMASSYNNIGIIHDNKGDYDKALEFYTKSFKIRKESGDKNGMANTYNNIGSIFMYKKNYNKALEHYTKALEIYEEVGNKSGMARSYNNIGIIYENKKYFNKALNVYFKSLKIRKDLSAYREIALSYNNIGNLYLKQGNNIEAKNQQLLSLNIAKKIGAKVQMYYAYNSLAKCDSALGNFKEAFEYYKLYSQLHDSVFSEQSNEKVASLNVFYESEKKQLQIEKLEKQKELDNQTMQKQNAESHKQQIIIWFVICTLILVLIFLSVMYKLFIQKKKANKELAHQKKQIEIQNHELLRANEEINTQKDEIEAQRDIVTNQKEHIEEIHKKVTDSINYATRLQSSILPELKILEEYYSECFILFKPKDKVSGDFYWWAVVEKQLVITVADCTGHGVPGAFMSMLGSSLLREIVVKEYMTNPAIILKRLRKEIINSLKQKGETGEQKDGMDISLLVVNTETNECQWAGANNPLYIVRGGQNPQGLTKPKPLQNLEGLEELKGDKMPIAIYERMEPFTNHEFKVKKGDMLYLFSDGFADQFGGPKNKKYGYKQFKEVILTNADKPMAEQNNIIEKSLNEWTGNNEQVDDITILGIKI